MLGRFVSVALGAALLLGQLPVGRVRASARDTSQAEGARERVERLGPEARVKVELKDGRKVEGRIAVIGEESFTVRTKNGQTTLVPYADVDRVRTKMSGKKKFLIALAIVGTAALVFVLAKYADDCGLARATSDDPCPPECTDC
ncbi:MAG TPA: hypothetical protein VGV38_05415 [Pyrinomonadaceae bacterium]|nr:hypothetical protein [Pyrinomonadaceae bacterium]